MTEIHRTNFRGFCVPATELNTLCGCVVCSVTLVVTKSLGSHGPPGSSVYEIFLTRILEWVAMVSSRGSSWPKDWTHTSWISCIAGGFFTTEPSGKPHFLWVVRIIELFFFFSPAEKWSGQNWILNKLLLIFCKEWSEDTILSVSRQRLMRRCLQERSEESVLARLWHW